MDIPAQKIPAYRHGMHCKLFAFSDRVLQSGCMTQPLALVLYEKLLPGSQLVNRLQDLNYRVQTVNDAALLLECAEQTKPMVVLADLESSRNNVCQAISRLKENSATRHLPVIGFGVDGNEALQAQGKSAGVSLVASDAALLSHLPQLLEQALHVD